MRRDAFIHTHLHSEHSLFDGMAKVKALVEKAARLDAPAIALTDHGVVSGWAELHEHAYKAGVLPIFGVEAYIVDDATLHTKQKRRHMCLLATSQTGFANLTKLATLSAMFYYYKPVLDLSMLDRFSEGVIVTTACLGGWCAWPFFSETGYDGCGTPETAERSFRMLQDIFGDRAYLEVQPYPTEAQRKFNEWAFRLHEQDGTQLIATNDVHYLDPEDAEMHKYVVMAGMGAWMRKGSDGDNDGIEKYVNKPGGIFMRTRAEMVEAFGTLHGTSLLGREAFWHAMAGPADVYARCGAVRMPTEFKIPVFTP